MNRTLLGIGLACAVAAAVLTVYVAGHPYIPQDAAIERGVQSINWGPLARVFPLFSFIGDTKGVVLELCVLWAVFMFNRREWLAATGIVMTGLWYQLLAHVIHRPRPTTAQVLQVTEHPGAWSFPSGHVIIVTSLMVMLMVGLGHRYLHGWARIAGWAVVAAAIALTGIGRVYTGTHWPTDVLAGLLIACAWICLWLSFLPAVHRRFKAHASPSRGLLPVWSRRRAS